MSRGERAMVPRATPTSYYGRPILKEPVWKWPIPAYFFTGGLAAGSSLLATGARVRGDDELARHCLVTAAAALGASTGLLVADLGKPGRFVNMLRVARPTSPMSMGSWLLAGYGPAAGVAAACDLLGVFPRIGRLAEVSAATMAPAVATYTSVLVADTAIPAWHGAHRHLPFVFASGAAASAGAAAVLATTPAHAGPARRLALLGAAAELISTRTMERALGDAGDVYKTGKAGRLSKAAGVLTAAGAGVLATIGRRRRSAAVTGGAMLLAGAAIERFAVVEAGRQSALDPRYTVDPQRARLDAR